jgi:hypothetical protein
MSVAEKSMTLSDYLNYSDRTLTITAAMVLTAGR